MGHGVRDSKARCRNYEEYQDLKFNIAVITVGSTMIRGSRFKINGCTAGLALALLSCSSGGGVDGEGPHV